jgi:hypothetical protein
MTCSDVERALPEFLDGTPDSAFPTDFDAHVKSCSACSDLISDLKLISSEARQLAGTEEPASRVWVRIAAELRAENLIGNSGDVPRSGDFHGRLAYGAYPGPSTTGADIPKGGGQHSAGSITHNRTSAEHRGSTVSE